MKNKIFSPLIAGVLIGIAATLYLKTGGIVGAVLFSFGLMGVVCWRIDLFTGKSGFWSGRMIARLLPVLLLNIAGVAMVMLVTLTPDMCDTAADIIQKRMATSVVRLFLLSACCGFIMTTAVQFGRVGNWWPLLLGVPVFILCGFPHCVADIAYWTAGIVNGMSVADILPVYIITVFGNYAGCNLPRLIPGFTPDPASGNNIDEETDKVS